jgi:hypothetical protein
VVDQQKRVEVAEALDRERPAHGEAAAFERAQGLDDARNASGLQSRRSIHRGGHGDVAWHSQGEESPGTKE